MYMGILSKVLNKGRSVNKSRKAPEGLKFLGESNRTAYLIKNDSAIRSRLLTNSLGSSTDYPSFDGMVLKEASSDKERKDNLKEYKTWNLLSQKELYREKLARTFLCTEDGKFLVMERVETIEGYDPERSDFAKKMKKRIVDDLEIHSNDVDIRGDAIGKTAKGYKIFDYPWMPLDE